MTKYKRTPLNETAVAIRPLLGLPVSLATFVGGKLKDFADYIGFDYTGRGVDVWLDLYDGRSSLDDAIVTWRVRDAARRSRTLPIRIRIVDLAGKTPTLRFNGLNGEDGSTPVVTPDLQANAILAKNSGGDGDGNGKATSEPSAKMADEPLYAKKGRRYVAVEPGQGGELYRRVKKGKSHRYVALTVVG